MQNSLSRESRVVRTSAIYASKATSLTEQSKKSTFLVLSSLTFKGTSQNTIREASCHGWIFFFWKYQHTNHRMHFASYFYSACHQKIEHQLHLLLHPPQKYPTMQRSCPSLSALPWQHRESSDEASHDRTSTSSKQGLWSPQQSMAILSFPPVS